MNNLAVLNFIFFGLFGILCVLAGYFLRNVREALQSYIDLRRRRRIYPSVTISSRDSRCKGPHDWDRIKLSLRGIPEGSYTVCTSCGFISTSYGGSGDLDGDYQLNQPGLEVYRNNIKRRDARQTAQVTRLKFKQQETLRIQNKLIREFIQNSNGKTTFTINDFQEFFQKANIELESLYVQFNLNDQSETD